MSLQDSKIDIPPTNLHRWRHCHNKSIGRCIGVSRNSPNAATEVSRVRCASEAAVDRWSVNQHSRLPATISAKRLHYICHVYDLVVRKVSLTLAHNKLRSRQQ